MIDPRATVVATTLNPFGALALQRRAFEAWAALGLTPLSFNVPAEADRLRAAGIAAGAIVEISEEETGRAIHGKPVPRVAPVLARLEALADGRPVLLVNADIHPAMASAEPIRYWLAQAPALALTREDCALLDTADATAGAPYRNGLDAFLFRPGTLAAVNRQLSRFPAAGRMAFGIPGWDFLLGAVVRAPAIGGLIMDGAVLVHEWHRPTYEDVAAFGPFVPAMVALGAPGGETAADAAYAFHQVIVADCRAAEEEARAVRRMYRRAPAAPPATDAARLLALEFADLLPWVRWNYDFDTLVALAGRLSDDGVGWHEVLRIFRRPGAVAHGFAETLLATDFVLAARPARAEPPVAAPLEELRRHLADAPAEPAARRLALAELFCEMLVAEGRYSPHLLGALALSCRNDGERTLLLRLRQRLPEALPSRLGAA